MVYAPDFRQQILSIWKTMVLAIDPAPEDATLDEGTIQIQLDNEPQLELPMETWTNPGLNLDATNKSFFVIWAQIIFYVETSN
jgi:hypothetical protein